MHLPLSRAWSHLNFRYEAGSGKTRATVGPEILLQAKLKTVSIVDLSGKQNLARDSQSSLHMPRHFAIVNTEEG